MILLISLLIGISFALLSYTFIVYLQKLIAEKKLKEKTSQGQPFRLKGMSGFFYFLAVKIGEKIEKLSPEKLKNSAQTIQVNLSILGSPYDSMSPYTFLGIQLLSAAGTVIFLFIFFSVYDVIFLVVCAILGFYIPLLAIKEKVKAKHKALFRQLPDVLDLLTLMVNAGLDFNNALNKILETEEGILIEEFRSVQKEIQLGKSRIGAFSDMAKKLNYPALNTVVQSLTNTFSMGGSLSPILKTLSAQFRTERAQRAEKLAGEAPLKLMFPLVVFIFPTIFIIIFGPIVLSFINSGGF